jgi:hypothetical protein
MHTVAALVFSVVVFVGVGCGDTAEAGATGGAGGSGSGGTTTPPPRVPDSEFLVQGAWITNDANFDACFVVGTLTGSGFPRVRPQFGELCGGNAIVVVAESKDRSCQTKTFAVQGTPSNGRNWDGLPLSVTEPVDVRDTAPGYSIRFTSNTSATLRIEPQARGCEEVVEVAMFPAGENALPAFTPFIEPNPASGLWLIDTEIDGSPFQLCAYLDDDGQRLVPDARCSIGGDGVTPQSFGYEWDGQTAALTTERNTDLTGFRRFESLAGPGTQLSIVDGNEVPVGTIALSWGIFDTESSLTIFSEGFRDDDYLVYP